MRTRVYVDGFSLFHGSLSKSAFKWLDLHVLFERVLTAAACVVKPSPLPLRWA